MKTILITLALFSVLITSYGQAEFEKHFYAPGNHISSISDAEFDSEDNLITAQSFLDDSLIKALITKTNDAGNVLWATLIYDTSSYYNHGRLVYSLPDNSIILSIEGDNRVVLKLDENGSLIWSYTIPPLSGFSAHGITSDDAGNLYLSGGGCSVGVVGLVKLNSNGELIWYKSYYDVGGGSANAITYTKDKNIFIGALTGQASDPTFLKVDTSGSILYTKAYTCDDYLRIVPLDVIEIANGNFVLNCAAYGLAETFSDPCFMRCDANGNLLQAITLHFNSFSEEWNSGWSVDEFQNGDLLFSTNQAEFGNYASSFFITDSLLNINHNFGHINQASGRAFSHIANDQSISTVEGGNSNNTFTKYTGYNLPNPATFCLNHIQEYNVNSHTYPIDSTIADIFNPNFNYVAQGLSQETFNMTDSTVCEGFLAMEEPMFNFKMYPNPSGNNLTIITSNVQGASKLRIHNLQGQLVLTKNITAENQMIDLAALQSGIYIVSISCNGKTLIQRLVKE